MRITDRMIVPSGIGPDPADVRYCERCKEEVFFVAQRVMVLSPSGARSMRLWACEKHPLPDTVTDQPDATE